ncbi:MAG: hypothetical protein ACLFUJ_10145 [Phycisphaerae bacterium]
MNGTYQVGVGSDPMEGWLWRIEQEALSASVQLQLPLGVDRDRDEVSESPQGRLVGIEATAAAELILPPLPAGLCYRARNSSLWIDGPSGLQSETLEAVLEETLDEQILRLMVMPELVAMDPEFLEEPAWLAMEKRYRLGPIRYRLDARGVRVQLQVEMEAC